MLVLAAGPAANAVGKSKPEHSAIFDWSMPSKFGSEFDAHGRLVETRPSQISKGPWEVDFQVNGLACRTGARYAWKIDGRSAKLTRVGHCSFKHLFPHERKYKVRLTATVGHRRLTQTQKVKVKDWLIVSIGDSVASGEGVPDIPSFEHAVWENVRCHRSARSGTAKAAQRIEDDDVHSSVTFVHLACSGATIPIGLLGPYDGAVRKPGKPPLKPQVDQLNRIEARRHIDAVLLSVGANDVHFSNVAIFCAAHPAKNCFQKPFNGIGGIGSDESVEQAEASSIAQLRHGYNKLNRAISKKIPRSRIHIVEYFDPTHDAQGHTCERILGSITKPELELAQSRVLTPLNNAVSTAAAKHHWDDVSGVAQLFRDHGYCAGDQAWVTTLSHSFDRLGGLLKPRLRGTLHPNEAGHQATSELIAASLERSFFPGQIFQAHPAQPPPGGDEGPSDLALVAIGAGGAFLLSGAAFLLWRRRSG